MRYEMCGLQTFPPCFVSCPFFLVITCFPIHKDFQFDVILDMKFFKKNGGPGGGLVGKGSAQDSSLNLNSSAYMAEECNGGL